MYKQIDEINHDNLKDIKPEEFLIEMLSLLQDYTSQNVAIANNNHHPTPPRGPEKPCMDKGARTT